MKLFDLKELDRLVLEAEDYFKDGWFKSVLRAWRKRVQDQLKRERDAK